MDRVPGDRRLIGIPAPVGRPVSPVRLGVSPEAVPAGHRIGDSVPEIAAPKLPMHALILGLFERRGRKASVGTVLTMMRAYVMWMLVTWLAMFGAWYWLGIPRV